MADSITSELTILPTPQSSKFSASPKSPESQNGFASNGSPQAFIPTDRPSGFRTLVLCFDGTGISEFDSDNSNIVELFTMLKKDDRSKQMVYYQAGIGTYTTPEIATPFAAKISKSLDEAVAWNLDAHVIGGYEFLMQNYTAGDRICIFGFSRGAYTARSLAGMIHKVGLLPACNHQQVPFAYKMFTRTDEVGWQQSNSFKKAFSIDVDIEFIGVWDTVNSVGLIPKRLPFTTSNSSVKTFRHALALDERRAKFKANHWNKPDDKEQTLSITDKKPKKPRPHREHSLKAMEKKYQKDANAPTDIEEVWFAGCHCDVGGGSVPNETKTNLARIPLRWMIRECFKTNSGIIFDTEGLRHIGLNPEALFPVVLPRPPALPVGSALIASIPPATKKNKNDTSATNSSESQVFMSEEELDHADALSPIYDQLSLAWFWWLLEFLPIKERYQKLEKDGKYEWITAYTFNWGRGRAIRKQKRDHVMVHRSVQTRMDAEHKNGKKYIPKAHFDLKYVKWVD
ncbi:hypothetical protein BD779DRAFT_1447039 [Infundibulicybe gibba]|nr:hypothetical protein BD779DRAFT_1447039 [Infundibulicybe gibba]